MKDIIQYLAINLSSIMIFMFCGWLISLLVKKASIADRMWGLGFVLVAWLSFYQSGNFNARKLLLSILPTIWGLRLFLHITARSWGKPEDKRYAAWRKEHGSIFWIVSLFKVFILQGFFLFGVSFVLQYGIYSSTSSNLTWLDYIGIVIWIFAIIYESIADWQLLSFKRDKQNKGKIMNRGLWSLSRHPNYFGEALLWWGIYIIVISNPYGFITIFSPILITYSLLKISGVTMMESVVFSSNKRYQEYKKKTNAFFPGFKK